jgi:hypothetical protein
MIDSSKLSGSGDFNPFAEPEQIDFNSKAPEITAVNQILDSFCQNSSFYFI